MSDYISTDVVIVGGGIMGSSTALALRKKGIQVILLERDFCGSRSSGVNYGGVRRQGRPACQLELAQRAHGIWGGLRDYIGIDGEYQRCGHLKLARTSKEFDALVRYEEVTRPYGLNLRVFNGPELRKKFQGIGPSIFGGSFCPEDGQANPRLVAPAFARAAQAKGTVIFEQAAMVSVDYDGSRFVVEAANGKVIKAPVILNSAGAWSESLARQFGDTINLECRHPSMAVTEPLPYVLPWSLGVEGGNTYCRQVARGNVVFGGGPGRKVDADRVRICSETLIAQFQRISELIPAFANASVIRTWSGTEGYLADRLPIICASKNRPGLYHAFGFSGAGFQVGPAVGEVMSELIADGATRTSIEAFGLDRFNSNQNATVPNSGELANSGHLKYHSQSTQPKSTP